MEHSTMKKEWTNGSTGEINWQSKKIDNNPNGDSRNYIDYIEKTKQLARNRHSDLGKLIYERDTYVAQGTFGQGDQDLARAQASLRIAGYDIGNTGYKGVDGKMGPKTEAAIRQVQVASGLEPTGKLDQQTINILNHITAAEMRKDDIEAIGFSKAGADLPSIKPGHEQGLTKRDEMVSRAMEKYPERKGENMKAQASLAMAGYDLGKSGVDGLIGVKTKAAIGQFQRAKGLEVTGELNPATLSALEETTQFGWTKASAQVAHRNELIQGGQGKGNALVVYAQSCLVAAGYNLGDYGYKGVDGELGKLTSKAIMELQKEKGLKPTGQLDPSTLWALEKATEQGWQRVEGGEIAKNKGDFDKNREFWANRKNWIFPLKEGYIRDPRTGGRCFGADREDGRKHAGVDFIAKPGTEVFAMTNGKVLKIEKGFYAGTDAIVIKSDDGSIIRYCEIRTNLKEGQNVSKGDVVAKVVANNKTGSSMLHLEVYEGTANGELSVKNDSHYTNVSPKKYQRRSDLIDPMAVVDLLKKIEVGK